MNTALPDIPRFYTALAEWLACTVYLLRLKRRGGKKATLALCGGTLAALALFLQATGNVPLAWWLPCMAVAVGMMYLFLYLGCELTPAEAGFFCAQSFVLAELLASLEWQLQCWLLPGMGAAAPLSLLLLAAVYGAVFAAMYWQGSRSHRRGAPLGITWQALSSAVLLALTAFAVSNMAFIRAGAATMNVFYIRTLVDLTGVLVLSLLQEQLRETALHREVAAMDNVLHRQYEQYRQSKENIHLLNRRYHDLKVQIAAIRAERDPGKQAAALDKMESGIQMYEAQNKTGNPVLDTLLTAKSLYCQQHQINFTCVADGRLLDFMPTADICTIVGTALDNATESVITIPDPEKRLIRAAVYAQNGFVMLRFENYCETPVPLDAAGLPRAGVHGGYGIKTIRATAAKYGGTATVHCEENWFTLRVLTPVQRKGK